METILGRRAAELSVKTKQMGREQKTTMRSSHRQLLFCLLLAGIVVWLVLVDEHVRDSAPNSSLRSRPEQRTSGSFLQLLRATTLTQDRAAIQVAERKLFYCNSHPSRTVIGNLEADEIRGQKPLQELGLSLVQANVIIRHGDRTGVHSFKGLSATPYSCSLPPDQLVGNYSWGQVVEALHAGFSLKPASLPEDTDGLADVAHVFKEADSYQLQDTVCGGGQLTPKGVQQHLETGSVLRDAYQRTLGLGPSAAQAVAGGKLKVTSTSYQRTLMSAASAITGLFGPSSFSGNAVRTPIEVCVDGPNCDVFATKYPLQRCSKARQKTDRSVIDVWQRIPGRNRRHIEEVFGVDTRPEAPSRPKMSHVVDTIFTRICHQRPVPCAAVSDTGECLSVDDVLAVFIAGDIEFAERFSRPWSRILWYPFFAKVVASMKRALHSPHSHSEPVLSLVAAHDSVLSPLLWVLGLSDGRWPPYAGRVSIELWRDSSSSTPASTSSPEQSSRAYVRIVYNGEDVTGRLHCRASPPQPIQGLCTLESFEEQVSEMLEPYKSYEGACE